MPTRYRDKLAQLSQGQLVITIDRDRCLLIYPLPWWEEVEQKLMALPSTNPVARSLQRLLLGHAEDCEVDAQGRVLLPSSLREYANLDRRVVLMGQGKRFELWDELRWQQQREVWLTTWEEGEGALPTELQTLSF